MRVLVLLLMLKGKFIVIYGVNNTGKTTQAKLLVDKLNREGYQTEYLKYPRYDLKPTGPRINAYLRKNNPENLSAQEAQTLYAQNRKDYENELKKKLDQGINIVAEDYTGTGIAWGLGAGVDKQYLLKINQDLLKEDLAFLFEGQRFMQAQEDSHTHETNQELVAKVRQAHLKLGEEFGWQKINANLTKEEIHDIIWQEVQKHLNS